MQPLHLNAFDTEDLNVLSAQLQDAVGMVADFAYLPATRRFAAVVNRFRWELVDGKRKNPERVRAGLHFDNVLSVKARNIVQNRADGILSLLSVQFEEGDAPSGTLVMTFSGDGEIRLEVEALEAQLQDITEGWKTENEPSHNLDD